MYTKEYTFTGFMPSGNPFSWYYDSNKSIAFTTSLEVDTWDRAPRIGDKIQLDYCDTSHQVMAAYINGQLVYTRTPEKVQQKEQLTENTYRELKRSRGFGTFDNYPPPAY